MKAVTKRFQQEHAKDLLLRHIYCPNIDAYFAVLDDVLANNIFKNPTKIIREHAKCLVGPVLPDVYRNAYGDGYASTNFANRILSIAERYEISQICEAKRAVTKTKSI